MQGKRCDGQAARKALRDLVERMAGCSWPFFEEPMGNS